MTEQFKWQSTLEETMVGKLEWNVDDYLREIDRSKKLAKLCNEPLEYRKLLGHIYDLTEEMFEFYPQECIQLGLMPETGIKP